MLIKKFLVLLFEGGSCNVGVVLNECQIFLFDGDVGGRRCIFLVIMIGMFDDDILIIVGFLIKIGVKIIVVGMGLFYDRMQLFVMVFIQFYVFIIVLIDGWDGIIGSVF